MRRARPSRAASSWSTLSRSLIAECLRDCVLPPEYASHVARLQWIWQFPRNQAKLTFAISEIGNMKETENGREIQNTMAL
jgi:hypothetical protein